MPLGGSLRRSQEVFIFGSSGGCQNSGRADPSAPGATARPQFVRSKKHFRATKVKGVGNARTGHSLSQFSYPSVSRSSSTISESFQPGTSNSLKIGDQGYSFVPPSRLPNTDATWIQIDNLSNKDADHSALGNFQSRNCEGRPINRQEQDSTIQVVEQQFGSWKPLSNKHEGHGVAKDRDMVQAQHSADSFMTFRLEIASDCNGDASSGYANRGKMQDRGKSFTPVADGVRVNWASNLSGVFDYSSSPKKPEGATHKSSMPCNEACRLDSCSVSLAPREDTEQFEGYDTLLHGFSKIGNSEGPSCTLQENQELDSSNIFCKQSREPFIFGASRTVSSGKTLSGLCAPDSSINSLASMSFKSGLDRFENLNRIIEAHMPGGMNKVAVKHSIPRKKNERAHRVLPNCRRRSRCSLSKGRRNGTGLGRSYVPVTRTPDAVVSPMDFSPCFDAKPEVAPPLGGNFSMPNLEQHSMFWGTTVQHADSEESGYRDAWVSIINEDPKVEELRTEAANPNISDEQGGDKEEPVVEDLRVAAAELNIWNRKETDLDNASCEGSKEATGQHFCWIDIDTSVPKSGRCKEGENTFAQVEGNLPNSAKWDIEDKSGLHGDVAQNVTVDCRHFTFSASSSRNLSTTLFRRHARRFRRRRPVGSMPDVVKAATSKGEVDSSLSKGDYETSNMVGLRDVPGGIPTSVSQSISIDPLLQAGVSTTENTVTKDTSEGNLFQTLAHRVEADKVRPAFTSRITDSLPADSPVQSAANTLHLRTGMPASPRAMKSAAAKKLCEQWRLRGNQAYANGDFPKAEEYYSRGANSVPPDETSQSCIRAAMLCYSNRAATRMAVGRLREALADCMSAASVDPKFLRVHLRAASCHLALGESKAAASLFKECLRLLDEGDKPEPKIVTESLEGLKKSEQLDEYSVRALEIIGNGNATDAAAALHLLCEALLISPHSEHLLEMKVQVLLSLRKYEEVVKLCEQSLVSAERNHPGVENEHVVDAGHDGGNGAFTSGGNSFLKLWRWRLSAKALFLMGRLKESLDLIIRCQEIISDKSISIEGSDTESLSLLMTSICDLLHHKAVGNEAFQSGRHAEAIEHYTAALACNGESRAFNAVCFCNRAAASQALGHIADAIADCSIAIALDPDYLKAISRRATLHEMVRDYGQTCHDLRKLVSHLENHQQQGKSISQAGKACDLKQACNRLVRAEEEMKKGHPPDHYLILGVDMACSISDIKKAYRKAALKHHPDKAGQFSVWGENGDDGRVWKEVGDDVRRDAECLFKMIGEAYAILSDSVKRLRYDADEEIRKRKTRGSSGDMSGTELHCPQYEKGTRRQREQCDSWNDYANRYQRWQSEPDAAQQDTYARRGSYASKNFKSSGETCRGADNDWYEV